MKAAKTASTSGKTPFDMIQEAEEKAAKLIAQEENNLEKEYENAQRRNTKHEEEKQQEIATSAKEELKKEKSNMGAILKQSDIEAQQECSALEKKAYENMPQALEKLEKEFFSLI